MQGGVRVRRHRADPRLAPHIERLAQRIAFRFHLPGNGAVRTLFDGPLAPGMLRDAATLPGRCHRGDGIPAPAHAVRRARGPGAAPARRADRRAPPRGPLGLRPRHHPAGDPPGRRLRAPTRSSSASTCSASAFPPSAPTLSRPASMSPAARAATARGCACASASPPTPGSSASWARSAATRASTTWCRRCGACGCRNPDTHLVIAGSTTPYVAVVRALIARLPSRRRSRVRLVLDIPFEQKADMLAAFDVFASPSGYESFGLTFIEAWAAGLPVVGCRAGAIPSVVPDGEAGLLVAYKSAHELAGALTELVDDPAACERFALAGRRLVEERYTWDVTVPRLERALPRPRGRACLTGPSWPQGGTSATTRTARCCTRRAAPSASMRRSPTSSNAATRSAPAGCSRDVTLRVLERIGAIEGVDAARAAASACPRARAARVGDHPDVPGRAPAGAVPALAARAGVLARSS